MASKTNLFKSNQVHVLHNASSIFNPSNLLGSSGDATAAYLVPPNITGLSYGNLAPPYTYSPPYSAPTPGPISYSSVSIPQSHQTNVSYLLIGLLIAGTGVVVYEIHIHKDTRKRVRK